MLSLHGIEKVEVPVEIGEMDLPKDHSIVEIVAEGSPGQCRNLTQAVHHGESSSGYGSGMLLASTWRRSGSLLRGLRRLESGWS